MWSQVALVAATLALGVVGPLAGRVLLVIGLLGLCAAQTLVVRQEQLAPRLVTRKAS